MMEVVVTTGAVCNAPVKSSPPTNQHPTFYRPDVLLATKPKQQYLYDDIHNWCLK